MTCIVGLVDGDTVWMGGDSAGVSGYDLSVQRIPKVFQNGEVLFGYTSSFRMGQLLQYKLQLPNIYDPIPKWIANEFIDEVRKLFQQSGFITKKDEKESGGEFLIGVRGQLFDINSDFCFSSTINPYDAIGCGEDYAKGALWADANSESVGEPPYHADIRVARALRAAAAFSVGVRSPFTIINSNGESEITE